MADAAPSKPIGPSMSSVVNNPFLKTLVIGAFYFFSSSMALIANKYTLKLVPAPAFFMGVQYAFSVAFCVLGGVTGFLDVDLCLGFDRVRKYSIVPVFFAVAIFCNTKMLENANVETFLVVRFSTCVFVALADFLVMGKSLPSLKSWSGMTMIVFGAVAYAYFESSFKAVVGWALAYVLVITVEMIVVKHVFNVQEMSTWTRVLLNNALSIPLQPLFGWMTNERSFLEIEWSAEALAYLFVSCICGLTLAYSGTALRHLVSATSFTVAGIVCKILTIIGNILVFPNDHASTEGLLAMCLSFGGSLMYSPAPTRPSSSVSSQVWKGLNLVSFGCLGHLQLESAANEQQAPRQAAQTKPIDEEAEVSRANASNLSEAEKEMEPLKASSM